MLEALNRFGFKGSKPLNLIRNESELFTESYNSEKDDKGIQGTELLAQIIYHSRHPLVAIHFACIGTEAGAIATEMMDLVLNDIRHRKYPPTFGLDGTQHELAFNTDTTEEHGYNTTLVSFF